jgi:hypothetical protein
MYEKLIDQHIDHLRQSASYSDDENPLFILLSVTFIPTESAVDLNPSAISPEKCFISFEKFYVRMLSTLMNNYSRKRHLQPLTYAYLDFPFSSTSKKYAHLPDFQKMKINKRLSKAHPETTPHIHSVMYVVPEMREKFLCLMPRLEILYRNLSDTNMTLDVQVADSLDKAVHYSSKLMKYPSSDLKDKDLYIVLPKSQHEPHYQHSEESVLNAVEYQ